MKKWIVRGSLAFVLAVFVGSLVVLDAMLGDHGEVVEHLESVEWLPASASDISYYRNTNISGLFFYEFSIDEAGFVDFAAKEGWRIARIESPIQTERYTKFVEGSAHEDYEVTVEHGYFFRDARGPSDPWLFVAYDSDRGIAYVMKGSR